MGEEEDQLHNELGELDTALVYQGTYKAAGSCGLLCIAVNTVRLRPLRKMLTIALDTLLADDAAVVGAVGGIVALVDLLKVFEAEVQMELRSLCHTIQFHQMREE